MINGICSLCGEVKALNREHVPPKSAFNSKTRFSKIPFLDCVGSDNTFSFTAKGKQIQGGVTFESFCVDCNNFLGSKYVNSYKYWAHAGKEVFDKLSKEDYNLITFDIKEMYPLRVIKSILAMFLAVNHGRNVLSNNEVRKFLKDPESNQLPDRYRIYTYLNREGMPRYIRVSTRGNFVTGENVTLTEITFPPYGYVLTIDSKLNNLTEITSFKRCKYYEKKLIHCKVPILATHLPYLPLDYRSKDEIWDDIEVSKNY